MAAAFTNNNRKQQTEEPRVNRWILDYFIFKAFDAFRDEDCAIFSQFRDLIQSLAVRPIEGNDGTIMKLRAMQFLARINDGDKIGVVFESQSPEKTPLELALTVLEGICAEVDVPQQDLERVHTSIREMLVQVCIKSKEFTKADEMLQKHFPKGMDFTGKKTIFRSLVNRKCCSHSALEKPSYSDFKQNMLDFIERLYTIPQPFLTKMQQYTAEVAPMDSHAVRTLHAMRSESEQDTTESQAAPCKAQNVTAKPRTSVRLNVFILKKAFSALAGPQGEQRTFSQLEEEVQRDAQQENRGPDPDELLLQLSESPVESSEAEEERSRDPGGTTLVQQDSGSSVEFMDVEEVVRDTPVKAPQSDSGSGNDTSVQSFLEASGTCEDTLAYYSGHSEDPAAPRQDTSIADTSVQNNSGNRVDPTEAPPVDVRPLRWGGLSSVARLVVEKDSQSSDLSDLSQESAGPPQPPTPNSEDPLSSLPTNSPPVRKPRKPPAQRKSVPLVVEDSQPSEVESPGPQQPPTPEREASDPKDYPSSVSSNSSPVRKRPAKRKSVPLFVEDHQPSEVESPGPQQPPTPEREASDPKDYPSSVSSNSSPVRKRPAKRKSVQPVEQPRSADAEDSDTDDYLTSLTSISPPIRIHRTQPAKMKGIQSVLESTSPQKASTPNETLTNPPPVREHQKQSAKRRHIEHSSESEEEGPLASKQQQQQQHPPSLYARMLDVSGTKEEWSDEESLFGYSSRNASMNGDGPSKRKFWTKEETTWIKDGVAAFGEGNWGRIRSAYPFKGRTGVNIKDRWRTMKKKGVV